jgi:hypothetical protein
VGTAPGRLRRFVRRRLWLLPPGVVAALAVVVVASWAWRPPPISSAEATRQFRAMYPGA